MDTLRHITYRQEQGPWLELVGSEVCHVCTHAFKAVTVPIFENVCITHHGVCCNKFKMYIKANSKVCRERRPVPFVIINWLALITCLNVLYLNF